MQHRGGIMKKKWIIPAIIAVVLVAIALFIAAYPILLFVAATDESIKQLNNSYINSDYQGWHEVTFFDKHHFSLPDTWRIEAIDDTTYCIYAEDARVIAFVGELGKDAPYRDTDAFCASMFKSVEIVSRTELHVGEHFGNGCNAYQATALMQDAQQEEFIYVFAQYVLSADFDKRCAILFQNDAFNRDEISEYAIAIAYSYRSGDYKDGE